MSGDASLPVERGRPPPLSRRQRDFLLLNIYVLTQQGYGERARTLAEAMLAAGDGSVEVHLARAVLRFADGRWRDVLDVLDHLDRIDPLERFGSYRLNERQRMRRYLRTRCLYELGETARVRDSLDSYMRHGQAGLEEPE